MVDLKNKNYSDFASLHVSYNSFRPVGIAFNKNENALYIVSIGRVEVRTTLTDSNNTIQLPGPSTMYYQNTGTIWKVTKTDN